MSVGVGRAVRSRRAVGMRVGPAVRVRRAVVTPGPDTQGQYKKQHQPPPRGPEGTRKEAGVSPASSISRTGC